MKTDSVSGKNGQGGGFLYMSTVDLAIQIKTVYLYTVFWQVNKSYRILLAIKLLDYKKDELKDDNII